MARDRHRNLTTRGFRGRAPRSAHRRYTSDRPCRTKSLNGSTRLRAVGTFSVHDLLNGAVTDHRIAGRDARQHGKASRDPWHLDAIALAEDQVGDLKISLRGAQPHTSIQQ